MPYIALDPSTAAVAPTTTAGNPLTSVGETLSSIRTELLAQLAGRTDVNTSRLNGFINRALRQMYGMLNIKETWGSVNFSLVSTAAGQPFYNIPVQVAWIKRFSVLDTDNYPIDGGRELEMIDETRYRMLPNLTEEPTSYFRFRRMVVIWPTPINARTAPMDFKVRPNDLVQDTDSPLLPLEFHDPLILRSRVVALRALGMYKEAALAGNDFLEEIRPLIDTDAEENIAAYGVMTPVRKMSQLFRARVSQVWNGDEE